jgi:hypothetical protein
VNVQLEVVAYLHVSSLIVKCCELRWRLFLASPCNYSRDPQYHTAAASSQQPIHIHSITLQQLRHNSLSTPTVSHCSSFVTTAYPHPQYHIAATSSQQPIHIHSITLQQLRNNSLSTPTVSHCSSFVTTAYPHPQYHIAAAS